MAFQESGGAGRRIFDAADMEEFLHSQAKAQLLQFVVALSKGVEGRKTRDDVPESEAIKALLAMLQRLRALVDECPPLAVRTRFGNQAFRQWLLAATELLPSLVAPVAVLAGDKIAELCMYLQNSFGHMERIDYGTGHEAHFAAFLFCLNSLGVIGADDYPAVVLRVFNSYLRLMRVLQTTYWLEPAGSHGIWGLDDYHFLPFLFGSSQLIGHKILKPKSIHNNEIVEDFAADYMYFDCIRFVNSAKTESLQWHSPMLNDISGVKTWAKVNEGMIKMYNAEVLGKLPVMQHFLFGSMLQFEPASYSSETDMTAKKLAASHLDHYHDPGNPNCCPRIPSALAVPRNDRIALPMD